MTEQTWSIIVPALNEEKCIGHCLDSLCALQYDFSAIEVILADNGSTDRTVPIALSYSGRLNITAFTSPNVPVGALRNAAVTRAKGRFLAFLDADCMVEPCWLQLATEALLKHPSSIVGSHYALPADAGWPARVWYRRFEEGRCGDVPHLPGGNLLLESQLFSKIGGFDTDLRSNEDSEFCSRAHAIGSRVLAFPELAAIHLGAEKNLQHFAKRQLWHGSNVLNRAALRANARAIGLAAYTLACCLGLLMAALARRPVLLIAALVALLLPPIAIALGGKGGPWRSRNTLPLMLLVLTYSLARAWVLPLALFRGIRRWSLGQR